MKYCLILLFVLLLGGCTIPPKRSKDTTLPTPVLNIKPDTCLLRIDEGKFYITDTQNELIYTANQYDGAYVTVHAVYFAITLAVLVFIAVGLFVAAFS